MIKLAIKTLLIPWILSVIPHLLQAQTGSLSFRHLTPNEGLTQVVVSSTYTDSRGFVWMTGLDGINRFDGIRCLANVQIAGGLSEIGHTSTVIEDHQGNIWIGTTDGIIQYSYETNRFTKHPIVLTGGLRSSMFAMISYDNSGNLLIETSVAQLVLYNYHRRELLQIPMPAPAASQLGCFRFSHGTSLFNDLYLVFQIAVGRIQVSKLVNIIDRRAVWQSRTIPFKHFISPHAYMPDPGLLYFSSDGFLYKCNLATGFLSKSGDVLFGSQDVLTYSPDGQGHLWISSTKGITVLDTASLKPLGSFQYDPDSPEGLSGKMVSAIIDRNNVAWINVWGKGVDYAPLDEPKFSSFLTAREAEKHGISNFIRGIVEGPDGHFYCATQSGVIVLGPDLKYNRRLPGFPASQQVPDINIVGNTLLIAADNEKKGFYVHDLARAGTRRMGVAPLSMGRIHMDVFHLNPLGNDTCLLSTLSFGLCFANTRTGKSTPFAQSSQNEGWFMPVYSYTSARGNVYACFNVMGFQVYRDKGHKKVFQLMGKYTVKHIVPAGIDSLWIGTTDGLLLFDDARQQVLKKYTTANGLPNNVVYALHPDPLGNLWLSTNKGLAYLDKFQDKFYNFTKEDGLQSNEFNTHAIVRARDGRIIFGGVNGLSVMNPQVVRHISSPPILQMTALKTDSVLNPFDLRDSTIVLAPGSRTLEVEWTAINYSNPLLCRIRYKLSTLDKDWQVMGNPAIIRYGGLSPGKYELEVMASNTQGSFTGKGRKIKIIVEPFWWQKTSFRVAAGMILVLITWLLIRGYIQRRMNKEKQRIMQQLLVQQERERIVADLHDDIGATLSSMRIYSELASNVWQDKPEEGHRFVDKVTVTSRELMERMSDIVWSMKPASEDKYTLEARLKNYCNELLSPKNIKCIFSIDKDLSVGQSHPEARKNLLLIAKEAINNIAKYSAASEVEISFQKERNMAILTIKDNGCGFDRQEVQQGNGLGNMESRCSQLGGSSNIHSVPGHGTTVQCRLPVTIFSYKS